MKNRPVSLARFTVLFLGCFAVAVCISCSGKGDAKGKNKSADAGKNNNGKKESDVKKSDKSKKKSAAKAKERRFFPGQRQSDDQVLRHAVFFKFKDSSSAEDVQKVVDEFAALPEKIDAIIDFQWGVNNSPEGLDDEFTHCFLLTFRDEAGREVYLPHDAHKAFGKVLGPHLDKVFVFDYWGTPAKTNLEKELKHAVFFAFKDEATDAEIAVVEKAFAALPSKIDTIKAFEWGHNNTPERHHHGFTHCFMVTFESEKGRFEYLPHPAHDDFKKVLKPVLDKARVLDFVSQ